MKMGYLYFHNKKDAFLLDLCSPGSDWFRVQFPLETFLFYFFRLIQRIWLIFIIGKYYGLNQGAWQFFPCCKWWIRAILSRRSVQGWPNFSKILANFFQMSLKNWAPWTERLLRKRLLWDVCISLKWKMRVHPHSPSSRDRRRSYATIF